MTVTRECERYALQSPATCCARMLGSSAGTGLRRPPASNCLRCTSLLIALPQSHGAVLTEGCRAGRRARRNRCSNSWTTSTSTLHKLEPYAGSLRLPSQCRLPSRHRSCIITITAVEALKGPQEAYPVKANPLHRSHIIHWHILQATCTPRTGTNTPCTVAPLQARRRGLTVLALQQGPAGAAMWVAGVHRPGRRSLGAGRGSECALASRQRT